MESFAQFMNSNSNNNMPSLNENAAQALFAPSPPKIELSFSKLNPGMFNATVNKEFPTKGELIDIKNTYESTNTKNTYR